jgi:hypothetical protein
MVTERPESRRTGVSHLAQRRGLILRESCYNIATRAPTVGKDSVVPDSKRQRGVHARYALLGTRSAGGDRRPGDRLGGCTYWPAAGFSSEPRAGVSVLDSSPARKRRARGRIEHTLLDGEFSVRPNRPKTITRNLTIPHKSYRCSYLRQRTGIPIKIPAWLVPRSGRDGGGKSQPDDGLPNLASWPVGIVNIRCSVFKGRFDTDKFVL